MGWLSLVFFGDRFSDGGGAGEVVLRIRRGITTTRGDEVAEKIINSLKMYRISLKYFYKNI